jgi:ubiquinol-cytochrome c reductase iron-sulfur subunit
MNRRVLLTRIVQAFAVTGVGALSYPFIKAFLPRLTSPVLEVSVADLAPGESKSVLWSGRQVLVQRRSADTQNLLELGFGGLKDPASARSTQPDFARNPFRSRRPDIFVAYANCTHLGCEVTALAGDGYQCPCHTSRYDAAGRVHDDAIAPFNLEVPEYQFLSTNLLEIRDAPKPG